MWDLSSLARDGRTCAPFNEVRNNNHQTIREALKDISYLQCCLFFFFFFNRMEAHLKQATLLCSDVLGKIKVELTILKSIEHLMCCVLLESVMPY